MRSLSKVIKSNQTKSQGEHWKTIQLSNTVFERPGDYTDSLSGDPVPILKRAEIEAKALRKRAQEEADRLLRDMEEKRERANKEIDQALRDAKTRGFDEGYQLGINEGRKQYETQINEARRTIDSAKAARRERLEETELDILKLAAKIAKKIIGSVLPEDSERWLEMVKKAILEVKEHEEVRLIVHHKWYEFMMKHKKELEVLLKNSAEFYIYPEKTIDEFTCILEFPYGRVDAGVDSQLTEIKRKLAAKLEETSHGRNDPAGSS